VYQSTLYGSPHSIPVHTLYMNPHSGSVPTAHCPLLFDHHPMNWWFRQEECVRQAQAKLQAKAGSFRKQLQGGETAAATQKLADMLMANLHRQVERS
jgi:hypothetical protein